jgi:hypothetical protein
VWAGWDRRKFAERRSKLRQAQASRMQDAAEAAGEEGGEAAALQLEQDVQVARIRAALGQLSGEPIKPQLQ